VALSVPVLRLGLHSAIPMSMFALTIDGTDTGPFTEPELVEWLEGYRDEHPADHEFRRVQIHELPEHGTVGHHRSVWDFVTRPGAP
jgi:hypothetical protein